MNRRRIIIALTCAFYALQVSLLIYWHALAGRSVDTVDAVISCVIAVILAVIDASVARYLLQVLRRSESVYAANVSERLEHSLQNYRLVAEREEELTREIGHTIEEELAEARKALALGRISAADEHIQASLGVASRSRAPHCDNAAVAAVLESKARQCEEANVRFDAKTDVPRDLSLPDVEVAAVFFNLIDNALHECEMLRSENPAADAAIAVQSKTQASRLFIEVTNTCRAEGREQRGSRWSLSQNVANRQAQTALEHGWGTSIVSNIAHDHGGLADFTIRDTTFVASVMIPMTRRTGDGKPIAPKSPNY